MQKATLDKTAVFLLVRHSDNADTTSHLRIQNSWCIIYATSEVWTTLNVGLTEGSALRPSATPLRRYAANIHTPSNCSSLHVNVRNVIYLHKQRYRSTWRRQQVAVKFQLHIVTRCQSFGVNCFAEMPAPASAASRPPAAASSAQIFPCVRTAMNIHQYWGVPPRTLFC